MNANLNNLNSDKQEISEKGANNGYALLDASGDVPITQIPAISPVMFNTDNSPNEGDVLVTKIGAEMTLKVLLT